MNGRSALLWPRSTQAAAAILVGALLLDMIMVVRLFSPAEAAQRFEPLVIRSAPVIAVRAPDDAELLRSGAARTPFGGTAALETNPALQSLSPAPVQAISQPRLMGTVTQGSDSFIVVEMPDARVDVVRIGGRAGDLRLRSISAGEAIFESPTGKRITLKSLNPGTPP